MADHSSVSSTLPSRDYHCKICDLYLDTADSLEVHLQYHKENLFVKWGTQNSQNDTENNNGNKMKSETTVSAPADSSDSMNTKPSPELQQRGTPETSVQYTHPVTPQSYHNAQSPYQNPDQTNFSPTSQFGNNYSQSNYSQSHNMDQVNWEQSQFNQQYHKPGRFHPYNMQERAPQVSSSSPLYGQPLNQPTPSPSPNQCDKCGFVCDSAVQLNEHCNSAHPPVSASLAFQQFSEINTPTEIKEEREEPSDILDLDSQNVVFQGEADSYQPNPSYEESHSAKELKTRPMSTSPWETQEMYINSQNNGEDLLKDKKMFADQKINFHPNQTFVYVQGHEKNQFMHMEQKSYPVAQMPPRADCSESPSNLDMKPPYRPYDSSAVPQITSTQSTNPISSTLPSIGGKSANWKSNDSRRPKTYNCTSCNKWFTSSGHLKRHYNTTLHKNAVRSSGQPDPATMPISSHHHPKRETTQAQAQQPDNASAQRQPAENGRGLDNALHSPYAPQNLDHPQHLSNMQSKPLYPPTHQGNIDNNFSNNPLPNHSLQHQIVSHPLNISGQSPGISIPNDNSQHNGVIISSSMNPPNGEAGPSVSQNQMRGLLSVSTNNTSAPVLMQTMPVTTHPLPVFSHLVNSYNPRPTDTLVPTALDPLHNPTFLNQDFQQAITTSYPNGMSPHVMDMAISNLPIASPATFGDSSLEEVAVVEHETSNESQNGRLPVFTQLQTQSFSVYVSNYITEPNVGGQIIANEPSGGYIIVDPVQSVPLQYNNIDISEQSMDYDNYSYSSQATKDSIDSYTSDHIKLYPYGNVVDSTPMKDEDNILRTDSTQFQILKVDNFMDYANKENFVSQVKCPSSPESVKIENVNEITSTVSTPLTEKNPSKKPAAATVHKCYECDKVFNKTCYLTQHNKTFHSGAKPFKCDRCGKRFADDVSYEGHCRKHTDNKPFKCNECPKSFNHKTDLRRHMCLHSGSKPFACDHCGKGFIRKDHMVKHYEIHLKKNGSRVRWTKDE